MSTWPEVEASVAQTGLIARGGLHPEPSDGVPAAAGRPTGTLVLVGNAGPALWRRFRQAPEAADGRPHPMDRWTRRVVEATAADLGATALYPFGGPPWWPFQRWALRCEPVAPSPLGMLVHPTWGLWHAYRAALYLPERLDLPERSDIPSPCASCAERPCLEACPVGAFTDGGYDVAACRTHLGADAGAPCLTRGCLARRACPVGGPAWAPEQAEHHMRAFQDP